MRRNTQQRAHDRHTTHKRHEPECRRHAAEMMAPDERARQPEHDHGEEGLGAADSEREHGAGGRHVEGKCERAAESVCEEDETRRVCADGKRERGGWWMGSPGVTLVFKCLTTMLTSSLSHLPSFSRYAEDAV